MFGLIFQTSSSNHILDRVRSRGLYRTPSPMEEFDCNIPEFDCSGVKLATDLTEVGQLSHAEFESFFDFPVMHDDEFLAFHDFMQGYGRH